MDLTKLSDNDLMALKAGDLTKVSDEGLMHLKGESQPTAKPYMPADLVKNLVGGAIRGAGSIGATFARPFESADENTARRARLDENMQNLLGADPNSLVYQGAKLGGEVAGTAGLGPAIGGTLKAIPFLRGLPIVDAITTGGMTGGNMLTRMAGGAITGGATDLATGGNGVAGAGLGAAAPPLFKAAGGVGGWAGEKLFNMLTPAMQQKAVELAKTTGKSIDEIVSALRAQGPSLIPGSQKTVPEILQNPEISQVARTLKSSGQYALGEREAANNAARVAALDRVAPTAATINEARANLGGAVETLVRPAEAAAKKNVRALFESVDPFNETAINLPIDAMKAAQSKFLGPGTFGTGSKAAAAIGEAERIGTDILPALKAAPVEKQQSLYDAVRSYGGINKTSLSSQQLAGEIRDLQASAQRGAVMANNGHSVEKVASAMHERGFIPDNDPATLISYLQHAGRDTFAQDANAAGMYARRAESAMGDLPGAEIVSKPVPFQQVQNLRSSLNEAWNQAQLKGANKEAAALKGMIDSIDNQVAKVAQGKGGAGESFPADIVQTWKDALQAHADKKMRFNTGPQAGIFRQGADGLPAKEGAEIAPLFWNSGNAQIENMQAFKRLTADDQNLIKLMKSNATTEALQSSARGPLGEITFDKFNKWMQNHSGAAKELFTPQELATLKAIQDETRNTAAAAGLGAAKGSPTFQNFFSNGALDNKSLNLLAHKIPGGNLALGALKNASEKTRNNILSELLSNPESMAQALQDYGKRSGQTNKLVELLSQPENQQLMYRLAPQGANVAR